MDKIGDAEVLKLLARMEQCRKELSRARQGMCFWSNELRIVAQAITDQTQLTFESLLKKECEK